MASSKPIIPLVRSSRKLDFRILINIVNVVCFGLIGKSATLMTGRVDDYIVFSLIGITAPAISVLWTTACIFLLVRSSLSPRHHPAIDLSLDLVSWLIFFIMGCMIIVELTVPEGFVQCSPYYTGVPNTTFCADGGEQKWNIDTVIGSLFYVNGLIHLVFFSLACHAVRLYRRDRRNQKWESLEMTK